MKKIKDKIALLEGEVLVELVDELSYLRVMINNEIIPTSKNLEKVNQNLDKTIENFDAALVLKTTEVIDKIDIDLIQKEVVIQVVKKFDKSIKNVNELSILSIQMHELIKVFHTKYDDIDKILNTYEKRIIHTKTCLKIVKCNTYSSNFWGRCTFLSNIFILVK